MLKRPSIRVLLKPLLAAVVTLVSAECLLRVYVALRGWTPNCYAAQLQLFRPHPTTGYDLRPRYRLKSGVYEISINSLGLRGREIAREKPTDVKRIALVGESSAFGYLVSDREVAAHLLEEKLRARGRHVEVLNGGVPGYNLFQSIVRFDELLAPLEPDLVIAYLGWNDLPYVVSDEPDAPRFKLRPVAPAWERVLSHTTLYGFVVYRLFGGPVRMVPAEFAAGTPTAAGERQFSRNLATLADRVAASGARLVLCAQATAAQPSVADDLRPALGPDTASQDRAIHLGVWLHETLADFAEERGLSFIDAYSDLPPTRELLADYVHLTILGEQRLADLWAEQIEAGFE